MTELQELFPLMTLAIAENSNWKSTFSDQTIHAPHDLQSIFSNQSSKLKESSPELAQFYDFLSQIFSMYFKQDDSRDPFGPMVESNTGRSMIPNDFTDKDINIIEYLSGETDQPIAAARLFDILWLRGKKINHANSAIDNYLKHADLNLSNSEEWISAFDSLNRATQIIRQLGFKEDYRNQLYTICKKHILALQNEPKDYIRIKLTQHLSKYLPKEESSLWIEQCLSYADEVQKLKNFRKYRYYLGIAVTFCKSAENNKEDEIEEKILESRITEAHESRSNGMSAMLIADKYAKAIEACRRIGGKRDLINELHAQMNKIQKQIKNEMKRVSTSIDVSSLIDSGITEIENSKEDELFISLAKLATPPTLKQMRDTAYSVIERSPLLSRISKVMYDENGRVVARPKPALLSRNEENEIGIKVNMISHLLTHCELMGSYLIEPARTTLEKKLPLDSKLLEELVVLNPFIPEGHEEIFLEGLEHGLKGQWTACAHILIPQLENSIRTYLERHGLLTTKLNNYMTQKEMDLNQLLYLDETKRVFGEEITFLLQALLVEEAGGNYRNRLAHGLLSKNSFYGGWLPYLWATTIRLCYLCKIADEE